MLRLIGNSIYTCGVYGPMPFVRWAVRLIAFVAGMFVILCLVVQVQQRTLRWRAEQLSDDVHRIRIYQSNWADAQRLMKRWGAWGQYRGSCTPESCSYSIELADLSAYSPHTARRAWVDWLLTHDRFNLYEWFGGRAAIFNAFFTVRHGLIWREGVGIAVVVSSRKQRSLDIPDKTLYLEAQSRQRLHTTIQDPFSLMGPDEGLAQHPYYRVGRPGGCMINCQMAAVNFSTHTPPAEIERLTSYRFSCFTQFHPCAELEDVLPLAKEWRLYREDEYGSGVPQRSFLPKVGCDIPVWALARDARYVLVVEALAAKEVTENKDREEIASVRVVGSLKQPAPWLANEVVRAYPFPGDDYGSPPQKAEHLVPGRRFIVFPVGDDRRDNLVTKDSPLRLARCGVQDDSPEVRLALETGFAQNDALNP